MTIAQAKETLITVKNCVTALDDKKAMDIRILELPGDNRVTDYFVIASATSEPHIRALKGEIEKTLRDQKSSVIFDYEGDSGWAVIDGIDFIIHIFAEETREYYQLEKLWKDATPLNVESL